MRTSRTDLRIIRVGQKLSDKTYVLSGVPQGSVLGPVLFFIFISTLGYNIPDMGHLFKYVDDTKYYGKVKNDEDICNFQERLNTLYNWADTNEMKWNSLKFQLLRMGPDEGLVEDSLIFSPNYQDIIGQSELVKDLGILIDAEMTYKNQRDKAILKANQKSGWVFRTFKDRNVDFLRRIWRSVIQPHQDYCCPLWAPYYTKGDLLNQEGPLRAFTKRAWGLREVMYWDRLKKFKLMSMQRRVQRYRCIYIWKIINHMIPDIGIFKLAQTRNTRTGVTFVPLPLDGFSLAFKTKQRNTLLHNGVLIYNSLPTSIWSIMDDLNNFKYELDRYLALLPDQPAVPGAVPGARDLYGDPSNCIIDWGRMIDVSDDFPTVVDDCD